MNRTALISHETSLSDAKRILLQKYVRGEVVPHGSNQPPVKPRQPGTPVPLSFAQEQIWSVAESHRDAPPLHNESITIHRRGPLDVFTLERAFTDIVRRHEAWRTTFQVVNGRPLQIIQPAPECVLIPVVDLRRLPKAQRENEALRVGTEQAERPFNLTEGPLVRATLVRLDEEEHRLFLTMHQAIVDGVSVFRVFPKELATLYESFAAGNSSPLPLLPVQFGDFACWQREWFGDDVLQKQIGYWRRQLSGTIPVIEWPTGISRPAAQTFRGAMYRKAIGGRLVQVLRERCQEQGVTLFMVLLAGFVALLHSYTGQDDIIIGTLTPAGRDRPEVQDLLGCFLNPLPLRFDLRDHPTFRKVLWQTREVISGALANDDVPAHYVERALQLKPDPSRNLLFQVALSLAPEIADFGTGWDQSFMDVNSGGARWDLYLEFSHRPSGIILRIQYNPDIFSLTAIEKMENDLEAILEAAAARPCIPILDLRPNRI